MDPNPPGRQSESHMLLRVKHIDEYINVDHSTSPEVLVQLPRASYSMSIVRCLSGDTPESFLTFVGEAKSLSTTVGVFSESKLGHDQRWARRKFAYD